MSIKFIISLLAGVLIVSLIANVFFYMYWYDTEYPHGEKGIWARNIEFSKDWYGYIDYITIGSETFEFGDFDVKSKVYAELDGWANLSYEVIHDNDPYWPKTIINITDHRKPCFTVTYHTYDAMGDGNEIYYYKQKVIDSLVIDGLMS